MPRYTRSSSIHGSPRTRRDSHVSQPHDAPSPPPPDQTHPEQRPQATMSGGDRGSTAPSLSYASDGGSRPPASALAGAWDAKAPPAAAEPAYAKAPASPGQVITGPPFPGQ